MSCNPNCHYSDKRGIFYDQVKTIFPLPQGGKSFLTLLNKGIKYFMNSSTDKNNQAFQISHAFARRRFITQTFFQNKAFFMR